MGFRQWDVDSQAVRGNMQINVCTWREVKRMADGAWKHLNNKVMKAFVVGTSSGDGW